MVALLFSITWHPYQYANTYGMKHLWQGIWHVVYQTIRWDKVSFAGSRYDFELATSRPPSPISCPEDHRLLITTVVKHWALTICSWSVQHYRNVVTNTTQLTHWIPSWDNSRDLHSGIPTISGILLSDMNGQIFYTTHYMNHPRSDVIC